LSSVINGGITERTTRLAKIYKVLDLAKIIGHKDIHELMIYCNPTIEELVPNMPLEEISDYSWDNGTLVGLNVGSSTGSLDGCALTIDDA
jgi:hypothetical protein